MKLLAIDPGSNEVGLYDGNVAVTLCCNKSGKDGLDERLARLAEKLGDFLLENGPYDFFVYEEQFRRGRAATEALLGAVGIIRATAHMTGAGSMPVPQSKVREWADEVAEWTGGGKKSKEDYKQILKTAAMTCAHVEIEFSSEHEYDAACVYYYVMQKGLVG